MSAAPLALLLKALGVEVNAEALSALLAQAQTELPTIVAKAGQLFSSLELAHRRMEALHAENVEIKRLLESLIEEKSDDARRTPSRLTA